DHPARADHHVVDGAAALHREAVHEVEVVGKLSEEIGDRPLTDVSPAPASETGRGETTERGDGRHRHRRRHPGGRHRRAHDEAGDTDAAPPELAGAPLRRLALLQNPHGGTDGKCDATPKFPILRAPGTMGRRRVTPWWPNSPCRAARELGVCRDSWRVGPSARIAAAHPDLTRDRRETAWRGRRRWC